MTNEEAIKIFKEIREELIAKETELSKQVFENLGIKAIDVGIKALEQQQNIHDKCKRCVEFSEFEQKPCEDCISREAVKEMLSEEWTKYMPMELDINLSFVMEKINELPSVTPQQRIGYWEYVQYDNNPNIGNWHCSECRGICREMHSIKDAYNYCPNCGADMRGDSE